VKIRVIRGKTELSPRISRIDTKKALVKTCVIRGKEKVLVQIRGVRGKTTGVDAGQI